MVKKAFLTTFIITTRVVVDVPEDFDVNNCNLIIKEHEDAWDSIVKEAKENILENPEGYLCWDNAEVEEDTECPYGEYEGD
jgi:hypothetical protein